MLIYLADIYHTSGTPNTPTPTNIGYVAANCIKNYKDEVEIKLFKNPHKLLDAIDQRAPDILGLSNYMWNEKLNIFICQYAKKINDKIITVTGGPNLRTDNKSIKDFLTRFREYNFCILYSAEIPFSNLVGSIIKNKKTGVKNELIEGCFFLDANDKLIGKTFILDEKNLDYIPSPFLTGLMDPFLEEGYFPLFETNRGCPFSCTFCVWGISVLHKIKTFSMERVVSEFNYVAEKFGRSKLWFLADANFGILPRDVEISRILRELHDKTHAFEQIQIYWTKNVTPKVYEISKNFGSLSQAYVALQSLDPVVLKLIKRSNISIEKLNEFKNEVSEYTTATRTDILLGQPGETMKSHIESFFGAMRLGFDHVGGGEIRLLPGSEMDEEKSRKEYGLKTKYRIGEGALGYYRDKFIFETEEVVRSTNWISEKEMLELRSIRAIAYTVTTVGELSTLSQVMVKNNINLLYVAEFLLNKNKNEKNELSELIIELDVLAKEEWFESEKKAKDYYHNIANKDNLEEISPVKLNFWVVGKLLKSENLYNQFIDSFKDALSNFNPKINNQVLEDLFRLSSERNFVRSGLKGDFSNKKIIKMSTETLKELKECQIIKSIPVNGNIVLSIPENMAETLTKRILKFPKLSTLATSQFLGDYTNEMQMQIGIEPTNTSQPSIS
jgi:radical SAM superfamily enzyme YgiQ (UPF0313 family)